MRSCFQVAYFLIYVEILHYSSFNPMSFLNDVMTAQPLLNLSNLKKSEACLSLLFRA
ncbi:hypothetical protein D3C79_27310 [compost metagenome]